MKGLRNKQTQETTSGTVSGLHQGGGQGHLSSRHRPIKRPNDTNMDNEEQYSFNILLGEDSDSDEENDECPFGRGLASSCHTTKEGSGAYHNLETFQKNQLKQKVSILRMDIRYNYVVKIREPLYLMSLLVSVCTDKTIFHSKSSQATIASVRAKIRKRWKSEASRICNKLPHDTFVSTISLATPGSE